jgi:hypothetical protein
MPASLNRVFPRRDSLAKSAETAKRFEALGKLLCDLGALGEKRLLVGKNPTGLSDLQKH